MSDMAQNAEQQRLWSGVTVPLLLCVLLVSVSVVNFLWFHTLAELFAVVVGVSLYLFARHSYVLTQNGFLLFLAQGFFWAAVIDLVHTLSYSGMGLVPHDDPNPATQLWVCARLLQAGTLLASFRFLDQRPLPRWSFYFFGALAIGGMLAVLSGIAPAAFVTGEGLTPFKVAMEYLIIAMLLLTAGRLWLNRARVSEDMFVMLAGITGLTIVSEFAFTLYVSVYGLSNLIGHIAKFLAFYLLYMTITERMLAQPFRALARDARSFDSVPMPVLLLSDDGVIRARNAAAREQRSEGGLGLTLHEAWHPAALTVEACPVCRCIRQRGGFAGELHDAADGTWASVRLQPLREHGFVCVHSDITRRKTVELELAHVAHHDSLTGLPNRLRLIERLREACAEARQTGGQLALLVIDLHRFRDVNDNFGHEVGDEVLRLLARRLRHALDSALLTAHLGGDEFAVLVDEASGAARATALAQDLATHLGGAMALAGGIEFRVELIIGIGLFPQHAGTADELLQQAAAAIDHARLRGETGCAVYDEVLADTNRRSLELERRLRAAVDLDQLELHFQPQLTSADGRVVSAEALVRWRDGDELRGPGEFIGLAERSGLIGGIGQWVLHRACEQAARWRSAGLGDVRVAVNVSPLQLQHGDIVRAVTDALEGSGLPASGLELELTESALMENREHVESALRDLRAMGIRIALDDFGTGYSSLAHLQQFPVDVLKIDRSFITDLMTGDNRLALVMAIIEMGHTLGCEVVAEGVEETEQRDLLANGGCDLLQGYLFSRPLPAADFNRYLAVPDSRSA